MPLLVHADAVEINGIYYNLIKKAKQAEVTSNPNRYSGSIDIPSTVDYEGITYNVTKIGEQAFCYCENVTSISIPNSITDIGDRAFMSCSFESIIIPNSVKSIDYEAFYHCRKLASITIGNGLEKIDRKAFEDCISLNKVVIKDLAAWCGVEMDYTSNPLQYAKHLYSDENTEITELVIPDGITSISAYAFYGCSNITSLTIPNSVEFIGPDAFGCFGITNVTIPNKITYLSGFNSCTNLKSITIPQTVTTIGMDAFYGCTGITSIEIPNSVTTIEQNAFGETSLTSVIIPNSVTSIGQYVFDGCNKLTSVTIGNAVQSIGYWAFGHCQELSDVYCYAEYVPQTEVNAFEYSLIEYATLHIPTASINAYMSTVPWSNFKTIMGIDGTISEKSKCATPTIIYKNGKLLFSSNTEGVEFVSEISDTDIKKNYGSEVHLSAAYTITVYATKSGYDNSDIATATLCWIDQQPKTEGITDGVVNVTAKAVLIKSNGGMLTVEGVDDGETIDVYTINGVKRGSVISQDGVARIDTNIQSGDVAIVKIKNKSVKVAIK